MHPETTRCCDVFPVLACQNETAILPPKENAFAWQQPSGHLDPGNEMPGLPVQLIVGQAEALLPLPGEQKRQHGACSP